MTRETFDKIESVVTVLIGLTAGTGAAFWQGFAAEFIPWVATGYFLFKGFIEHQKSKAVTEKTDSVRRP